MIFLGQLIASGLDREEVQDRGFGDKACCAAAILDYVRDLVTWSQWGLVSIGRHGDVGIDPACTDVVLVEAVGIIDEGDKVVTDDCLRLRVAGLDAFLAEYTTTQTRGSGDDRKTYTLFQGAVLVLPAPRPITGSMSLRPHRGTGFKGRGLFTRSDTRLEHPGLHEDLLIQADDPQSVFFVMPPSIQERWVHVREHWRGRAGFAVHGDRLLLAFDAGTSMFELDWRSRQSVVECLERICAEFESLLLIADALGVWDLRLTAPRD